MSRNDLRTTATVTISCYWMETSKHWLLVARNDRGAVLSRQTVDTTHELDRARTALVLRAVRTELESHLL